jgi:hypothetical protein
MIKRKLNIVVAILCATLGVAMASAAAQAEVPCRASCSAWWHVDTQLLPASLPPGGEGTISVSAENFGDAGASDSSPVVFKDKLPEGFAVKHVELTMPRFAGSFAPEFCETLPREVICTLPGEEAEALLGPYALVHMGITVEVASAAKTGAENLATISGGGAPTASSTQSIVVGGEAPRFGIENYELLAENADGSPDTQAGSHPFQLTTDFTLNETADPNVPPQAPKDLHFDLPPGLIGNPTPFPECPLSKFLANAEDGQNFCPDDTVVGIASVTVSTGHFETVVFTVPVFVLTPSVGEPARFGFYIIADPVYLDTSLRTGGDYGVTVSVNNISEAAALVSSRVTFWGVPGDPRHDPVRGWNCLNPEATNFGPCTATEQRNPPPLLTLPSACTGPVHTTLETDSWEQEGAFTAPFEYTFKDNLGHPTSMDGCNQVPFTPSIKVTPDGQAGSTPTGLTVDEHVPQETGLNPTGLAESDVKGLSVTLPMGVALNPAAADGLQACSLELIGLQSPEPPGCPEAAKVATAVVRTPLLAHPLEGAAYLATQDTNPFGSLVALYLYVEDPVSGIRAKAAGEVLEDPASGQLTAHFEGDPVFENDPRYAGDVAAQFLPQTPFEDVELHFFGGDRAPLVTPTECGSYTTTGTFTPWSESATVESSSTFDITAGPDGRPCPSPVPFNPTLTTGTTSIQAGGFSPFVMTISREDGEQNLQGIALKLPLGVSGTLSTVKLCDEAQADAGTCGPESEIGETLVSVGVGGDPYTVKGGKVYITGPYEGAPFGLSIVNPAKAGPFDLGKVIVRAKLEVNEETAAITVKTDSTGPYKIPTIIDGIPLQIRHVLVNINRPNFTFNATNCSPLAITGEMLSAQGATATLQAPYHVTNCAVLAFKPKLQASVSGRTSRANGASFHVRLGYEAGPYDANIARVKVELPKAMPSRLTTLQKACTAAVFNANPASCPPTSIVGRASASTPVLPVPLEGPAYFVSHGGEAFPSLIIVLQGYGVTVQLVGSTYISKTGITSSTFKTVPDVPVGSFELTLPQGRYSALTSNTDLCKAKLAMPTEFVGQNGAVIKTNTKIAATGCGKAKRASHKRKSKHRKAATRKRGRKKG